MTELKTPPTARSKLPADVRLLLAEIEREAVPERLHDLAVRLQAALDAKLPAKDI